MKKDPSKQKEKLKINEIIVVEGRDDITAIKRVVDAHIIALNGFSALSKKTINKIVELSKNNDLILFTDPDFAGKKIRDTLNFFPCKIRICDTLKRYIPNIKHAFVSQKDATKNNNIGVENANDEAILEALKNVITANQNIENRFSIEDLIDNGFVSGSNAKKRRVMLGNILKIGYYNAKQLLKALNSFNISKEQFEEAVEEINSLS